MDKAIERLALLFYELDQMRADARPQPARQHAAPLENPSIAVSTTVAVDPALFRMGREIAPLLGKLRNAMAPGSGTILYVTSAVPGEGVSTVARELACAAAMSSCNPLLLDCNPGGTDQGSSFGQELPSVVGSYAATGRIEVAAVDVGEARFHAATLMPSPRSGMAREIDGRIADLCHLLRSIYNPIIVDCPPVLEAPQCFPAMEEAPDVLLVVEAERTRMPVVLRAKEEIAMVGGHLIGVVMNKRRFFIPRFIYSRL